jgi:hypothetical protein
VTLAEKKYQKGEGHGQPRHPERHLPPVPGSYLGDDELAVDGTDVDGPIKRKIGLFHERFPARAELIADEGGDVRLDGARSHRDERETCVETGLAFEEGDAGVPRHVTE